MFSPQEWPQLHITRILVAHQFVLDSTHRCEYPIGRGTFGLVYALDGTAEYRFFSGTRCRMQPGDIVLLAPTAAYTIAAEQQFRHYTINFEASCVAPKASHCLLHGVHEPYVQEMRALCSAWSGTRVGNPLRAVGLLYELLAQFAHDHHRSENDTAEHRRLQPVKEYIEAHCCDALTLEQLSHLADMSVTNFRREWKRLYSETPMQYRDRLRILRAKEYLSSGYYTVGEVAARCGFEDTSYFVRFFKKHTGQSPGQLKNGTPPCTA